MKIVGKFLAVLFTLSIVAISAAQGTELTIATVNNSDMIIMQELSSQWEAETGNKLNWLILEENVLRQRVTTDISTGGGQFDIITIGAYETPLWGKLGWLNSLDDFGDDYAYEDLFPSVRNGLSVDGSLYSAPFYAESSFTFYRHDLFEAAGLTMPDQPSYDQILEFAKVLHDPANELYGVCLRGKAGWGENMAYVSTLVNTFGGRWFDEDWNPQLDSPEWNAALSYYVDLLTNYGPPGASSNGHNENRALFASGNCAMWVDATSAAGYIFNPDESTVADKTSFAEAPIASCPRGSGWFWAWALGIPSSSQKVDAAKSFIEWATSQEYVDLVGESKGWVAAPPGTRLSTYAKSDYVEAAPFAGFTESSIVAADPANATCQAVPYTGVQFVAIPEFQAIGTSVGQTVAAMVSGQLTVEEGLASAQEATVNTMKQAGYIR
ncbi:MAG: sugar ABC transporter substrate-binding protein [Trueperaceae bacterium]|nr:MAG: sugar ABC transporter substrate-binding protein [Trueperaceae bacterium]